MAALLDEVASYLVAEGHGALDVDLFKGYMPPDPATAVAIYESSGLPPAEVLGADLPAYERPRLQVKVRASDYPTARTKIDAVWASLLKVRNQTLSTVLYLRVAAVDSPALLERDDQARRVVFVANFDVWRVHP